MHFKTVFATAGLFVASVTAQQSASPTATTTPSSTGNTTDLLTMVSELPTCALGCLEDAATDINCTAPDLKCLCSKSSELVAAIGPCLLLSSDCSSNDTNSTFFFSLPFLSPKGHPSLTIHPRSHREHRPEHLPCRQHVQYLRARFCFQRHLIRPRDRNDRQFRVNHEHGHAYRVSHHGHGLTRTGCGCRYRIFVISCAMDKRERGTASPGCDDNNPDDFPFFLSFFTQGKTHGWQRYT